MAVPGGRVDVVYAVFEGFVDGGFALFEGELPEGMRKMFSVKCSRINCNE